MLYACIPLTHKAASIKEGDGFVVSKMYVQASLQIQTTPIWADNALITVQHRIRGMSVKLSDSLVYLLDSRPDGVSSGDERPAGGTNSIGPCTKTVHCNEGFELDFSALDSSWRSLKIPPRPSSMPSEPSVLAKCPLLYLVSHA